MKAFEKLTVSNVAVPLSAEIYSKNNGLECCNKATILVETANIRYRVDGDNPTSSLGLLANNGDVISLIGRAEIKLFRAIREAAADAALTCDYGVCNDEQ